MPTKEEILAKAAELGLKLSDEQIAQHIKDGTLPGKQSAEDWREELKAKYTVDQLVEKLLEAWSEAKDRRLENKELKEKLEKLNAEFAKLKDIAEKYPAIEQALNEFKENEKKRRIAILEKFDENKRNAISYLTDIEKISASDFDTTIALLQDQKLQGMPTSKAPGEPPKEPTLTKEQKAEADRMGLSPAAYLDVMRRREERLKSRQVAAGS